MLGFLARSVVQKAITLVLISIISFYIVHLAPGDPSQIDPMNPKTSAEAVKRLRETFHLDEPIWKQYFLFYRDLYNGDMESWKDGRPVFGKIWERFLNSVPLFIVGTIIVWTLSFPVGISAAIRRGSFYDRSSTLVAYLLISVPGFFLAYVLIILVVQNLQVPILGIRTFGMEEVGGIRAVMDRVWHLVLPSVLGAAGGIAWLSRYVRSQMLEVEGQDYVRTARAKGLSEDTVHYRHALRNAMMPFVTMFGLLLPGLIGGSVIIEKIFAWPGMGRLAFDAIVARDLPVVLTLGFFSSVLVLIGTLISDILYVFVDPRVKYD
jgi:peptide/nickel transport system permease protein